MVKLIACEACGNPVSPAASACPKCGHPVTPPPASPTPPATALAPDDETAASKKTPAENCPEPATDLQADATKTDGGGRKLERVGDGNNKLSDAGKSLFFVGPIISAVMYLKDPDHGAWPIIFPVIGIVSLVGLIIWLTTTREAPGKRCAPCGSNNLQKSEGTLLSSKVVGAVEVDVTEHWNKDGQFSGTSEREVAVSDTIKQTSHLYTCLRCGHQWTEVSESRTRNA